MTMLTDNEIADACGGDCEIVPPALTPARPGDHTTLFDDYGADKSRRDRMVAELIARGHSLDALLLLDGQALLELYNTRPPTTAPPLACATLAADRPPVHTFTTGFPELDAHIGGGLQTRSVTGIIARTGAGKTGLVLGIGHHVIRTHGVPFLYVSSELDEYECGARSAAQALRISHGDILAGRYDLAKAREAIEGLRLYVVGAEVMDDAHGARAIELIEERVGAIAQECGERPVVAVDFLQELADASDDPQNVRMGVSRMARKLRALARRCDVAVIAVSSTARAFYKEPKDGADDPLSYLGAAKESGDIEFALANLLFLDVAEVDATGHYPARIVVSKARRGTAGFVGARFHGPSGQWEANGSAVAALAMAARQATRNQKQDADDDAKVLAAVTAAAGRHDYRTQSGWKTTVAGVPQKRCTASVARLIEATKLEFATHHPKTGDAPRGGGAGFVVLPRPPVPPAAPPQPGIMNGFLASVGSALRGASK